MPTRTFTVVEKKFITVDFDDNYFLIRHTARPSSTAINNALRQRPSFASSDALSAPSADLQWGEGDEIKDVGARERRKATVKEKETQEKQMQRDIAELRADYLKLKADADVKTIEIKSLNAEVTRYKGTWEQARTAIVRKEASARFLIAAFQFGWQAHQASLAAGVQNLIGANTPAHKFWSSVVDMRVDDAAGSTLTDRQKQIRALLQTLPKGTEKVAKSLHADSEADGEARAIVTHPPITQKECKKHILDEFPLTASNKRLIMSKLSPILIPYPKHQGQMTTAFV